jgi:hypothetical protein
MLQNNRNMIHLKENINKNVSVFQKQFLDIESFIKLPVLVITVKYHV